MARSVARLLPSTVLPAAVRQIAAVAAVGALGTSVLAAAGAGSHGVSATASSRAGVAATPSAVPHPLPMALRGELRSLGLRLPTVTAPVAAPVAPLAAPAARAAAPAPAARALPRQAARPARLVRWLPTGTGMWIYEWKRTAHGRPAVVVSHARQIGLTTLYIRTGSTHDGYTGDPLLGSLLPATKGTGVRVVTWDFPELKHPVDDARRLARTAWYNRQLRNYPHVAAVAPDIETPAEGTRTTRQNIHRYLTALRALLPRDVAILATVPWPSHSRRGHYPYAEVAMHSDALLPMAYWYNNPPQLVTQRTMGYLRQFRKPVQPVGQGYDGHKEWRWLPHNNLKKQVPAFFATAHQMGASAVSLWSWQAAPPDAWIAISRYRGWFAPRGRR